MTDDLVKRLRLGACALEIEQAADRIEVLDDIIRHDRERIVELVSMVNSKDARIEELEADLRRSALNYIAAHGQAAEAYQAQLKAEAKLAKAGGGLNSIAANTCCNKCQEAALVARTTLTELKGETDD